MRKIFFNILCILFSTLMITSCDENNGNQYEISFNSNGGLWGYEDQINSQYVFEGGLASQPASPTLEYSEFIGWYTDPECTVVFDFNTPIYKSITLYAGWERTHYIVTFVTSTDYINEESGLSPYYNAFEIQYIEKNGITTEPIDDPTFVLHQFEGWYSDDSYSQSWDFNTPIIEDTYIFAKWTYIADDILDEFRAAASSDMWYDSDYTNVSPYKIILEKNNARGDINELLTILSPLGETLETIIIHNNQYITGTIPDNIGEMFPNVTCLYLSQCSISGSIPESLHSILERGAYVNIAGNCLSGKVPSVIASSSYFTDSKPNGLSSYHTYLFNFSYQQEGYYVDCSDVVVPFANRDFYDLFNDKYNILDICGDNKLTVLINWDTSCAYSDSFIQAINSRLESAQSGEMGIIGFHYVSSLVSDITAVENSAKSYFTTNNFQWVSMISMLWFMYSIDPDFGTSLIGTPSAVIVDNNGKLLFNGGSTAGNAQATIDFIDSYLASH